MNLEQLIEEVNKDLDDSLDSADITGWINRGLDDLTPIAKKETMKITGVTPENVYTLPDDLHEIAFVRVNGEEMLPISLQDKTSRGYKEWGGVLYLQPAQESGDIELFYYKKLSPLVDMQDVPEIPSAYHDLLVLYATALSQYAEEEPERQIDALNRYYRRKEEFQRYIQSSSLETYQVQIVNPYY
ncbi:phage adaptor protein [Cytobacillus sp. FSL R5-0596]|uniref:phage adaptor protein n=1 Tax=Cytobacillus sp. FSL R5-0596 TaxID=2954696 RepID=UPI0030F4F05F